MINNENNNLDMNQPTNENVKEYYVEKIEEYEELNEKARKSVYISSIIVSICTLMLVYSPTIDDGNISVLSGVFAGINGFAGIYSVACDIAKKAGLESRIHAIEEKLELLELKNNQNFGENNENINNDEKGRSL